MSISIKPEIYLSWIPNGEIKFIPKIYASVVQIPHVEKATADTSRNISTNENISADTFRKVGVIESTRADFKRKVTATEKATSDLNRKIGNSEKIQSHTFRKLTSNDKATGKLFRHVKKLEKFPADTSRKTGLTSLATDLFRIVKSTEKNPADILRRVGNTEKVFDDTLRKVTSFENISADLLRRVSVTEKINADTFREVANLEKTTANTFRKVAAVEKISADTFLQIKKTEKVAADTLRGIREKATADTLRKVTRPEKVFADTAFRVPHILNYVLQDSIINSFKDYDVTAFNVTLNERTLSDSFNIETAKKIDINDAVKGLFLDYPYSFLVEETTEQSLIFSVKGMYDIDKLLYSFVRYENVVVPATTIVISSNSYGKSSSSYSITGRRLISMADADYNNYTKADYYAKKCAEFFGLTPNIKFENFSPSNLDDDSDITYSDLISSLFSWTAKVPQRQINVFIRGEILHFIQRGLEDSVFDISNIPHSRPVVNKKLIRTLFNTPFDNDTLSLEKISNADTTDTPDTPSNPDNPDTPEDKPTIDPEYFEDEIITPFTGTLSYRDDDESVYITYHGGLTVEEGTSIKQEKQESTQTTTYGYTIYENEYYLKSKTVINTVIRKKIIFQVKWLLRKLLPLINIFSHMTIFIWQKNERYKLKKFIDYVTAL